MRWKYTFQVIKCAYIFYINRKHFHLIILNWTLLLRILKKNVLSDKAGIGYICYSHLEICKWTMISVLWFLLPISYSLKIACRFQMKNWRCLPKRLMMLLGNLKKKSRYEMKHEFLRYKCIIWVFQRAPQKIIINFTNILFCYHQIKIINYVQQDLVKIIK